MIRFISRKWPPAVGGMETYSQRLAELLPRYDEVDVLCLPGNRNGQPPRLLSLLIFGLSTAAKLMTRQPAHVLHLADMSIWPLGVVGRMRSGKSTIVLSAHGTDVGFALRENFLGYLYKQYLKLGAKLLSNALVIANSRATARIAADHGFSRLAIVPLGTNMTPPHIPDKPLPHVFFSGRLIKRKGCAWFIHNVLPLLREDITLRVAGPVWDESERLALTSPRVTFLGCLDRNQLAVEYASALCAISPNIDVATHEFEGFGLTATDAAAAGGIALASLHSGLAEALIDGLTGFHLPPGDPSAWKDKIESILEWRPSERRDFIERSIRKVQDWYSWDRVAMETFAAYANG